MSIPFRIHIPPARVSVPGNKTLLHTSEPPQSPSYHKNVCDALESDKTSCTIELSSDDHAWCEKHLGEMKSLENSWYAMQVESAKVSVYDSESARRKVQKMRLAVELRRQIRERFFPRGGDTTNYIDWIADVERELYGLADYLMTQRLKRHETPEVLNKASPGLDAKGEKIIVIRSALDPAIPAEALNEIPDDGTIQILKRFYVDLCTEAIQRLYRAAPDLNDAQSNPHGAVNTTYDAGAAAVRAWFRIMVFNDSEAHALEHATKSVSIDQFLRGSYASQLETYCDFFEKAWRPHAAQYLRVAVCAQTLAGQELKTIQILGGMIPSTTEGLKMKKPSWDILYRLFPKLLTPWTLASICQNFEDYITINKLLMIGMYPDHWTDATAIMYECPAAVYLGFIPSKKGDFSHVQGRHTANDHVTETEARNYLTGQMAIGDPLTSRLLDELRRRSERIVLVVYEGTNADATVCPSDQDLFICRHRRASVGEDITKLDFTVDMTIEDVKNDLRLRKSSTYDPIVVDSWQFIIIDRKPGLPFGLFDIIQDALLMLHGDPSPRQLAKKVIREIIPASVQEIILDEMKLDCPISMLQPSPPSVRYEGNRQRFWMTDLTLPQSHPMPAFGDQPRNTNRFIQRMVEDMEHHGIIKLVTPVDPPDTRPVIVQGTDGMPDVYFPYKPKKEIPPKSLPPSILDVPEIDSLQKFARRFQKMHPKAVMAKGCLQPHYCAWPMPAVKERPLCFGTYEGHVYEWRAMPFDADRAEGAWTIFVNDAFEKLTFIDFNLATFVICAATPADVVKNMVAVYEEAERKGWRLVMPEPEGWKSNVDELRLLEHFYGVPPAVSGGHVQTVGIH